MHSRTTLAAASLVLGVLWYTVAAAQSPAVAPDPDSPGVEQESDTDTNPKANDQPEQTEKPDTKAKKKQTAKQKKTESRSPTLTQLDELVVEADRPLSAASSKVIRTRDYELRPHSTTQEILNNLPGLVVVQHQGGGKAVQWLIRGFDADHGTDFAVFTDGIPVNLVSHAHGQGYADINYLIPETVKDLQLFKGPYFVQFGDFATAGALSIETKDEYQQNFALAEGGYFDTQRYVLGGSPKLDWAKTLLTAEAYFTNGPFENPQHYARYNVFTKLTLQPTADRTIKLLGSVYYGDWDGSGQIPVRATQGPDAISRFGAIDPSEGGTTDRENLSIQYNYKPDPSQEWNAQIWGSRYYLKLFSDFTFFKTTGLRFIGEPGGGFIDTCANGGFNPATGSCGAINPNANYIPGDGIEQTDQGRLMVGSNLTWTKFWSLLKLPYVGEFPMQTQLGLQTRRDQTTVSLNRQVRRNPFFGINDVSIAEQSVSGFWGQQFFFTDWTRLEAGVRGDVFFFDVGNELGPQPIDRNFGQQAPNNPTNPDFISAVNIAGNNTKGLASPKVNLVLGPWQNSELYFNYGNGFHSNDARSVVLTGTSGLTAANGYEVGSRTRQFDRLDAAAALWLIDLGSELVFSGDNGTFEASGPTRRWGIDFETRYQITDWLFSDFDITYADPRFKNGDAVPLAPTILINSGITAELGNGFAAALRLRHLGRRPANEDRTLHAQGWTLLDMLLRYRWRNVELTLSMLNLTDTSWREAQFADETCLKGEEKGTGQSCPTTGSLPSPPNSPTASILADGIDGITFTPGNPFNIRGGLQIFF